MITHTITPITPISIHTTHPEREARGKGEGVKCDDLQIFLSFNSNYKKYEIPLIPIFSNTIQHLRYTVNTVINKCTFFFNPIIK